MDTVAVGALARGKFARSRFMPYMLMHHLVFETVGLSLFLTWWGTHTNPFE